MMDRKIETYLAKAGMLGLKIAFEEKDDGSIVLERVQAPGLKKYRVPDFVNEIGQQAFARSEELESVLIPSSVKVIGRLAFLVCRNLRRVVLTKGLKSLGYGAFDDCERLEQITLPEGVVRVGDYALSG